MPPQATTFSATFPATSTAAAIVTTAAAFATAALALDGLPSVAVTAITSKNTTAHCIAHKDHSFCDDARKSRAAVAAISFKLSK